MKTFYEIKAPEVFKEIRVAETLSSHPMQLKGRTIKLSLKEIMPNSQKDYFDVKLRLLDPKEGYIPTELISHETARDFITSVVRRGRSKISLIIDVKTKDAHEIRVKCFAITLKKTYTTIQKEIRKIMKKIIEEEAKGTSYYQFMLEIFENKLQGKVIKEIKRIYPIRVFEIYKTELLK
jgi:small subunit ribosomal protein S3Ae